MTLIATEPNLVADSELFASRFATMRVDIMPQFPADTEYPIRYGVNAHEVWEILSTYYQTEPLAANPVFITVDIELETALREALGYPVAFLFSHGEPVGCGYESDPFSPDDEGDVLDDTESSEWLY